MCLQIAEVEVCQILRMRRPKKSSVNQAVVDAILNQAAQASAEAPNRALKRRVRQRLHKKLGAMLTCEEFGRAMDRFGAMEEKANSGATPCLASNVASYDQSNVATSAQAVRVIAMPYLVPIMAINVPRPVPCQMPQILKLPQQSPQQMPKIQAEVQEAQPLDLASQSTTDNLEDDSLSELSSLARAVTLGSSHLPVERTFIQFDTRMHVRRRSRSV
eukprot:CAMPEP_0181428096 /NCGR_PEP_ID=MMETSP1110-20121109/16505_1 /TAXON_ID=174948 /ORGANISM="Symbiodinium sp., Strain CCMP421" /LENGTH=216 /DNA_ID=CAMNT_0023551317 /DNA_START=63 /DNA_END=713 /DNA_ORIENTATION=+